ncbi:hypothetical protein [Pseudonocardia sp. HH130630-07]|uniref:hypothetical protein n=1 Tax=Pseudonocardia sp. HH130630-07 TaxID=1690815 RepID=UPI003FA71C38
MTTGPLVQSRRCQRRGRSDHMYVRRTCYGCAATVDVPVPSPTSPICTRRRCRLRLNRELLVVSALRRHGGWASSAQIAQRTSLTPARVRRVLARLVRRERVQSRTAKNSPRLTDRRLYRPTDAGTSDAPRTSARTTAAAQR